MYVNNIVGIDKTHLDIDLRKFRLSVCSRFFVTETSNNLEIFIDSADH